MLLRPLSLEIEGFKSFKKKAEITFPEKGLMLVSGYRKDSNLSSGTGKSSILEAIAFCLDINSTPATELKNDDSKNLFAKLVLTDGTNTYSLTRDPKFSLEINGKKYESLSTGAKEYFMQNIVKCSEDVLKIITYREQRTKGEFINSTDSELKEFLTNPLNLGELESAVDKMEAMIKDLERSEFSIVQSIDGIKSNISFMKTNLPSEVGQEELELLQSNLFTVNSEIASFQSSSSTDSIKEINDLEGLVRSKASVLEDLRKQIKNIESTLFNVENLKKENIRIKEEVIQLHSFIEHANGGVCTTCERDGWNNSKDKIDQTQLRIEANGKRFSENLAYIKNSEGLRLELPHLEANRSELASNIDDINRKIAVLRSQLNSSTLPLQALNDKKKALEYTISIKNQQKESRYVSLKKIGDLESQLDLQLVNLAAIKKKMQVLRYAAKLIGKNGFMGSVFDEILVDIQNRSNDMISAIPNVNEFTIKIDSSKEVKSKGTTKKQINVSIHKHGKDRTLRQLSGGQQCSVELCTDLAAAEAIRSRSGSALGWVCLDEAMDGFGVEEKQAAIEMIKTRVKGLVIIIDHATEIKESFDKVLQVEYDGRESYVVSQ